MVQDEKLSSIIEADIIPRLLLTHTVKKSRITRRRKTSAAISSDDFETFVNALLNQSFETSQEVLMRLRRGGVSVEAILLELMAPAARRLGEMWTTDQLDFMAVTIGLSNLHKHFHNLRNPTERRPQASQPKILLAPAPQEQHIFGLLIVGEMFQRAGWSITTRLEPDPMDLLAVIGQEEFDAVGITVACTSALPRVTQLIDDLRVHSVNPNLMVLGGGALFQGQQHLAAAIGADYVTSDVAQAVDFASRLLEHKRL